MLLYFKGGNFSLNDFVRRQFSRLKFGFNSTPIEMFQMLDPRRQMESNPAPLVFIIQFDPLANNLIPPGNLQNFASI